ncbi:MAG: trimethylamine methyltransferase family protein [Candidatus Bathyarchaeota archaeon]|nr:MAG: trimethylamine methyltransferase family protein [Candidatus Bathyarchaeota archaeon]
MRLNILSRDELESLHLTILEVFEKTGVKVHSERAFKTLKENGADVDEKTHLTKIPSHLVEEAIRNAPSFVHLYGRNSKYRLKLERDSFYTVLGSTVTHVIDPETFERVTAKKTYVEQAARVADALPNIHVAAQFCLAMDCPPENQDVHEMEAVFTNTIKPAMVIAYSLQGVKKIIEIGKIIKGGIERLKREPLFFVYSEPTSPLEYSEKAAEILIETAKLGLPILSAPCVQAGATGPVTLAGTLVQSFVESLTGLIIAQLTRKGTPCIIGEVATVMDMKTAVMGYGAPEFSVINAASSQLAHYYKIPFFGTGGCSDSKLPDAQAVAEATMSLLMAMLTGTNLIHDIGYLESATTGSLEMVIIEDELYSMLNRVVKGMKVSEETLALDVINDVGPGGHYLSHQHTLKLITEEHWFPNLIDRSRYGAWKAKGKKDLLTKAREKLHNILREHEPEPLSNDVLKQVEGILESPKSN